ncbi:MAG TPA: efflux RND transporter periplasmic adaptor subunit, partial [Desulfopila sp.]|nr:efflux RND transporter periplasmic adaptor subunit [Desulfopila sp.]
LVERGQQVTMLLDYLPGRKWEGTVDYVYPTLDAKTRTLRVRLRFDNEDGLLKPDMFAQVIIHAGDSERTLLVPKESIIRTGLANRLVLALGDGRFKSVNVEVGRYDQDSAEILSGLEEGEEVVTSAQFLIDSESSKTSDFKRIHHGEQGPEQEQPASVWTTAMINEVMADQRQINATHEEIAAWEWPEMTMDFAVAEEADFSMLEKGKQLNVEITKGEDDTYLVTAIHDPAAEEERDLGDLSLDDMNLDDMSLE